VVVSSRDKELGKNGIPNLKNKFAYWKPYGVKKPIRFIATTYYHLLIA